MDTWMQYLLRKPQTLPTTLWRAARARGRAHLPEGFAPAPSRGSAADRPAGPHAMMPVRRLGNA